MFYLPAFCFAFLSLLWLPRTFTKPTTNASEGIKEKVRCQVMTKPPPGGPLFSLLGAPQS